MAKWWTKCFYSTEQQKQFTTTHDHLNSEEMLNVYEIEIENLQVSNFYNLKLSLQYQLDIFYVIKVYYNEHENLLNDVRKWSELFELKIELEENARASKMDRYKNRGAQLLIEERERKKVEQQLPKAEKKLLNNVEKYDIC